MKMMRITPPFSRTELLEASVELVRRNRWRADSYLMPTAYLGFGDRLSVDPEKLHMGAFITSWLMPQLPAIQTGIHCAVSSWERISDHAQPPRIKANANYVAFRLATVQAKLDNYDEAILLDHQGKVSEAPGACIFIIRDGIAITPTVTSSILESITRAVLLQLFSEELGIVVQEREVDRTELYIADEVLLCGTGKEIVPVLSVDRHAVADGQPGTLTRRIQNLYFKTVRGESEKYRDWLTPVYPK